MNIVSIDYFLPPRINSIDLLSALRIRASNYSLALSWSCLVPDESGVVDSVAVQRCFTDQFTLLGRSVLEQFSDAEEAVEVCANLGFSGIYVSDRLSASDMADICARKVLARNTEQNNAGFSAIIYAHTTPEEHPNLTPSFLIQTTTKSDQSLPFSVSGSDSASFISALQVAETVFAMNNDARPALMLTADRFLPPIHTRIGDFTLFSDAACAIVLDRTPVTDGYRVLGTQINPLLAGQFDWAGAVDLATAENTFSEIIAETASTLLQAHSIAPNDIAVVVPQYVNPRLTRGVLNRLPGLPEPSSTDVPHGNFATSAIPIALKHALSEGATGALVLGWCMGLDGTVGASLFEIT